MPNPREEELIASVLELLRQKAIQLNSDEPRLANEFIDAVVATIDVFQVGDLPRDCMELFRTVEAMKRHWDEFEQYVSGHEPRPRPPFWRCLTDLENLLTFAPPEIQEAQIEPLALLKKQNCTSRMIAVIYSHKGQGHFMRNGQPVPHLVDQELDKPGSVLPKDFVHPAILEQRALRASYSNRIGLLASELRARLATSAAAPEELPGPGDAGPRNPTTAPETLDELILAKVGDNQIVKMKGCTLAEINIAKARLDAAARGELSPAELADVEAQVGNWLADNPKATNAELADMLGCEVKVVAGVRRKLKEAPKAGASA